jgi:uncharacterized protein YjbI with pentapeptide repeats
MANDEHVAMLKRGVDAWNEWRGENPYIRPNLREAHLIKADLGGADLRGADLSGADLSDANLSGADLSEANLSGARLSGANLKASTLVGTDLWDIRMASETGQQDQAAELGHHTMGTARDHRR